MAHQQLKSAQATLAISPAGVNLEEATGARMIPWCEINALDWDGQKLRLQLLDPNARAVIIEPENAPEWEFLEAARQYLTHAIVLSNSEVMPSGTVVSASVRRDANGKLFSVLVAHGPISAQEQQIAAQLEARVCEAAGLSGDN